ncbi:MAG: pilus assembly protein [Pseudobdellovibrionaceae bacterium]
MKFFILLLLFISDLCLAETLILKQGETSNLPVRGKGMMWVENNKSIDVTDLGSSLRIFGRKPGTTSLSQDQFQFQIEVLDLPNFNAYHKIRNKLLSFRGLSVTVNNGAITIEGSLLRLDDWLAISKECANCNLLFSAEMTSALQQKSQTYFLDLMKKNLLPATQIKNDSQKWQVLLPESMKNKTASVKKVLSPFGIQILTDDSLIEIAPMIRVQILVAEVKRKAFQRYGLKWPGSYQAQVIPQKGISDLLPFDLAVNALEEKGYGKVLAQPTLVARSGKEAQFFAGGEIPIKVSSFKSHEVVWKKYGVILTIRPIADFSGKMSIGIETEVSSLDSSQVIDGIPALFTNRIQSHFDLSQSQTIALSGLIKSDGGKSAEGLPWLSRLPVLGPLFSSQDYRESKTELVVFVTPSIAKESDPLPALPSEKE